MFFNSTRIFAIVSAVAFLMSTHALPLKDKSGQTVLAGYTIEAGAYPGLPMAAKNYILFAPGLTDSKGKTEVPTFTIALAEFDKLTEKAFKFITPSISSLTDSKKPLSLGTKKAKSKESIIVVGEEKPFSKGSDPNNWMFVPRTMIKESTELQKSSFED